MGPRARFGVVLIKRSILWRLYAILLGIGLLFMYVTVLLSSFRPVYLVDLPITVAAYIGLLGYSLQCRIGRRPFWRLLGVVFVCWELLFNFVLSAESLKEVGVTTAALFMLILLLPEYVALWLYGHRSSEIWARR